MTARDLSTWLRLATAGLLLGMRPAWAQTAPG